MAQEDPSRPQWPSNPSNGWASGVDRLTGLPNGLPLTIKPSKAAAATAPIAPATPLALAAPRGCSGAQAALRGRDDLSLHPAKLLLLHLTY